ncbi:immune inhibitor A domain-containing protein [Shewanella donghaensis]|uniref:immune inhibitor A domain-containing protein n=1 Tax=Shewanella donghaensis TaxID=238836 RepID=UPI001181DE83|nr:immune inhibitor A domain-containing protein [Shewanella donghaensis]
MTIKVRHLRSTLFAALAVALSSPSMAAPVTYSSPADGGVINSDQIVYWLTKRGELKADATEAEKNAAVALYTRKATPNNSVMPAGHTKMLNRFAKSKASQQRVVAMSAMADSEITKTVNVLAVLVDFPDLPYNDNRLTKFDTAMFYSDYSVEHYQDILFSRTGFTGPNGENLQTASQYFTDASGDSFFFNGEVKGWVTADNNAADYGGNDADNDDNDIAVPDLVMEAVAKATAGMSDAELAPFDIEDPYDLNNNGNTDEPDGVIDHIVIFHSSIGEETGGGVLGTDAIWSHRFFVETPADGSNIPGTTIPGKSKKVYGYTVQPIDSASGVITHEFGHDLGLPDEYDTTNVGDGSPVGSWSLMSAGSWVGSGEGSLYIAGAKPSGFSPYARSFLQEQYKGKWVNEQKINLDNIDNEGLIANLVAAENADGINQLSIDLPAAEIPFEQPLNGKFQYYSGKGDEIENSMNFELTLPEGSPLTLSMQAHWNIEVDYDYAQVLVNGIAIAGNHTTASNQYYSNVSHFITGESSDINSIDSVSWVELSFDLSAYAGTSVTVEIKYVTDQAVGDYGIAIDDITVVQQSNIVYEDGAETEGLVNFSGFSRIGDTQPGLPQRYIVQLRNHQGIDSGLGNIGYEPGVLLWLENSNYADNNVSDHAGYGLIGVVDADQNLIGDQNTDVQIRDAAFSLQSQTAYLSDSHLNNVSFFDDNLDYSAPLKPQAGMVLPQLRLTMEVTAQANNSETATVEFTRSSVTPDPNVPELEVSFTTATSDYTVDFTGVAIGGVEGYTYAWQFGEANAVSAEANPSYTYATSAAFNVTLTVTDAKGNTVSASNEIEVVVKPSSVFDIAIVDEGLTVKTTNNSSGGFGTVSYLWEFGDDSTSKEKSPTNHTYASAGQYSIFLTVTDEKGNQAVSATVFTLEDETVVVPEEKTTSSGGSLGWLSILFVGIFAHRRHNRKIS